MKANYLRIGKAFSYCEGRGKREWSFKKKKERGVTRGGNIRDVWSPTDRFKGGERHKDSKHDALEGKLGGKISARERGKQKGGNV